ncbi:MAG: hypothetical protein CMG29_02505 [Candidatus Marinimicrobia bacterium]|nr:hypothetical protein [Candidatus Neomarinimicrobiota bacterium]
MVVVLLFPDPPPHFQGIAQAPGRDQGRFGALQGKQCIGGNGRSMYDGFNILNEFVFIKVELFGQLFYSGDKTDG